MDLPLVSVGLPIALAIVMFGLGMSLTPADFRRVATMPKAVLIALGLQLIVLPAVAFGLVVAFDLPGILAVGVMLLAASPGGTTANLYSHLFRGDVALNISLTALNSVIAVVTLPIITNFAIWYFDAGEGTVGLQFDKVVTVFAIVLVPVALGMVVRRFRHKLAERADKPVRIFSILVLAIVAIGALISEWSVIQPYLADVGWVVSLFCILSLTIGYFASKAMRLGEAQAVATAMEIGIHNTTIALTIAISVLGSIVMAVPAAVYSIAMYIFATLFGFAISRVRRRARAPQ
ncbi:MAG TPA: bile acid:sodium symporter family protein [Candidatus Agrococcus pullicola]|uniref:Bile acid:sodium symporter family protein n=1 Tax=Candidatus Agrococcus pullicola TaxID=2838429 RepID=A0A9D1YSH4_9MICO|nr:bile acid:sodium symporter family protein [Candidatus Agrococcus pullicola]